MEGAHAEGCVHAEGRVPAGLLHLLATWADPEVCIFMTPILLQSLKVLILKLSKDHFILFKSSLLMAGFCSLLFHLEFSATYRTDFD